MAGVTPAYVPVEELVQELKGDNVEERLMRFLKLANGITFAEEAQMRMALKVYLDTWFANRGNDVQSRRRCAKGDACASWSACLSRHATA